MSFFGSAAVLAQRQHSTITTSQLKHHGYSDKHIRRLVAEGVLTRAATGVFVVAGSQPTWHRDLAVALHRGGPPALVGHRSAAGLWHLDRFRVGVVEIVGPWRVGRTGTSLTYHRTTDLPSRDRTVKDGLAITTPTRTLIDMARYVGAARLGSMVDDAVRRDLTSYEDLHQRLSELARPGRAGIARMRAVLAERPGGAAAPGSPFEARVRDLLVGSGLPVPVLQHPVDCGEVTYLLDLAWPDPRVAVECDGFRFHRSPDQLEWDARRQSELALRGWLIHHVTWRQLRRDSEELIEGVRAALRSRMAA